MFIEIAMTAARSGKAVRARKCPRRPAQALAIRNRLQTITVRLILVRPRRSHCADQRGHSQGVSISIGNQRVRIGLPQSPRFQGT